MVLQEGGISEDDEQVVDDEVSGEAKVDNKYKRIDIGWGKGGAGEGWGVGEMVCWSAEARDEWWES